MVLFASYFMIFGATLVSSIGLSRHSHLLTRKHALPLKPGFVSPACLLRRLSWISRALI